MYWCDAVEAEQLDCGVHAALANELFTDRGLTSFTAQFVEQYDHGAGGHWTQKWTDGDVAARWIDGERVYHEGCAVLVGTDQVKLWDASAGWWVDPKQNQGYGAVLAVRVLDEGGQGPETFDWEGRRLPANQWVRL